MWRRARLSRRHCGLERHIDAALPKPGTTALSPGSLMKGRTLLIVAVSVACVLAALLLPAVPQPLAYHDFADQRELFGVERFFDVFSNLAFLMAGLAGLVVLVLRRAQFERPVETLPYLVFFVGVVLTAAGSAWYHLVPDNERLVWDRLPMTIAFMALICAQIVERINVRTGLLLLIPLLIVGMTSVFYWIDSERSGAGNVLPYALLQAWAVFMLLLFALSLPSRYTRSRDLYWVFGVYVLAKLLEHFDQEVLALGNVLSGHTLKHIAAAVGGALVGRMLWLRVPQRRYTEQAARPPGDRQAEAAAALAAQCDAEGQ